MQTANFFLRKVQICMQHLAASSMGTLDLRGRLPLNSEWGSGPSFTSSSAKQSWKTIALDGGVLLLTETGIGDLGFLGLDLYDGGKVPSLMGLHSRDLEGGLPEHPRAQGVHSGIFPHE